MNENRRRQYAQERKRKRNQKRKLTSGIFIVSGLLLATGVWYLEASSTLAKASSDYSAEDIVYGQAYHAVHEMNGSSMSSIPFLPKDQPQPKIAVSESSYNFGSIGATEVVTHDFVIQNVGEAPLIITRAYTTCGCTTADFTATTIPPGKVIMMTLTFDAGYHDTRGQTVRRSVIIENNDPKMPQLEIWTKASVADN